MTKTAIKLIVNLWHDDCPEDPCVEDWKVYSFSRRHGNFKHPDDIDDIDAKLKAGLAFFLDYFEHGQCAWSLSGEDPQCRWDTARNAGVMVWEQDEDNMGAKTVEDRRADAQRFIERFTEYCNGSIYGYTVEAVTKCCECGADKDAEVDFDPPSCGGYYGSDIDGMVSDMKDNIGSDWAEYEVTFKDNMGGYLADEVKDRWKVEA